MKLDESLWLSIPSVLRCSEMSKKQIEDTPMQSLREAKAIIADHVEYLIAKDFSIIKSILNKEGTLKYIKLIQKLKEDYGNEIPNDLIAASYILCQNAEDGEVNLIDKLNNLVKDY